MARRRAALVRIAAVLALATGALLPSVARADVSSSEIVVPVYGFQEYHHDANKTFEMPYVALPSGISFGGTLTCSTLEGGVPITNDLPGGQYRIDPSSCSGLTLVGPGAENYTITYVYGAPFVVNPTYPVVTTSSTGMVRGVLTGRMTYTSRAVEWGTGAPIAGVRIEIRYIVTPGGAFGRAQCSSLTGPDGVATCTAGPVSVGLFGASYIAATVPTADYSLNYGKAAVPFF
jgi:hypothetical protein